MVRINRLFGPAALLWPLWLGAQTPLGSQTQPELARILERLDKLERDNRALSEEVRTLRARLDATGDTKTETSVDGETVPGAGTATAAAGAPATIEERLDIQGKRIDEQAQTKVEASQKFPIRLTGMALFNAFMNSKQNGGVEYPVTASAPGAGLAGATLRQTIMAWISEGLARSGAATSTARSTWIFPPGPPIPPCGCALGQSRSIGGIATSWWGSKNRFSTRGSRARSPNWRSHRSPGLATCGCGCRNSAWSRIFGGPLDRVAGPNGCGSDP